MVKDGRQRRRVRWPVSGVGFEHLAIRNMYTSGTHFGLQKKHTLCRLRLQSTNTLHVTSEQLYIVSIDKAVGIYAFFDAWVLA